MCERTISGGERRRGRDTALVAHGPSANDGHFNDRLEVDISSMRQLVTDAMKNPLPAIDEAYFC